MEQLFKASLHTHTLVILLLILSQLAFFWVKREENFIRFSRKVKTLFLIQSILFAMVVFTGLLMLTVLKWKVWSIEIILMILLAVAILVHQVLLYKRLRPIKTYEQELQQEYKSWASKVLGAEIIAEIVVFVLAFILK